MLAQGPEAAPQCKLLAGPAALSAQLILAVLAFASLVIKRHRERPQRELRVWGMDVSKQVASMAAAHACGMLIAVVAHHATSSASECAWYFVAYTFDTTLGLLFTLGLHQAVLALARRQREPGGDKGGDVPERWSEAVLQCGNYGDPPSTYRWAVQLIEWVLCVIAARAIVGTLVLLCGGALSHVAGALDRAFAGHPTLLLFFVMICCPLLMNMVQVLIQDAILKWKRPSARPVESAASSSSAAAAALVPMRRRTGEVAQQQLQQQRQAGDDVRFDASAALLQDEARSDRWG